MSATTENLLERIKLTEETLLVAKRTGAVEIIAQCETDLKVLRSSLMKASEAIAEGKQLLKS
jgi:hypothetical protein